jgi:hypothetical protein
VDRALDVVLGHVGGTRGLQGRAQARIGGRVRQAGARGDLDLAHQAREGPGPLGVLTALAVHDVLELRMASHVRFTALAARCRRLARIA